MLRFRPWRILAGLVACTMFFSSAVAGSYPDKPIRLIVGFPPGGAVDLIARAISQPLSERLGQPVVIENRAGAGGNIAAAHVARSEADGYTFLVSAVSSLAISASAYKSPQYQLLKDLAPVAIVAEIPNVLVVNPQVPARSVAELIELAKKQPGALNFGSAGPGTTVHFAGELFKSLAGVDLTHVPYRGAAPAMADLLGGRVEMMFDFLSASAQHIQSGNLRALAVTSATRSPMFPDLPTVAEAGVDGYEVLGAFGIMAPAGTPADVIQRINKEVEVVTSLPQVKERFAAQAATALTQSPDTFQSTLEDEVRKWAKIVEVTGVQLD